MLTPQMNNDTGVLLLLNTMQLGHCSNHLPPPGKSAALVARLETSSIHAASIVLPGSSPAAPQNTRNSQSLGHHDAALTVTLLLTEGPRCGVSKFRQ
jgi:hypothetical protein